MKNQNTDSEAHTLWTRLTLNNIHVGLRGRTEKVGLRKKRQGSRCLWRTESELTFCNTNGCAKKRRDKELCEEELQTHAIKDIKGESSVEDVVFVLFVRLVF